MGILKKLRNSFNLTQKELAKKLSIEQNTLSQYETDKLTSFKIIKNISTLFTVSLDYLILEDNCNYPRSLNFINLAIKLCKNNNTESISHISKTIETLLQDKKKINIEIKLDNNNNNLENNFHSNLKILRNIYNLTQKQIANELNIIHSVVAKYEINVYPSIDKMIKLSEIFNYSIHALVTGEKLSFDFKDKNFENTILIADHLLSIEDKSFLIKLMTNLIKTK